MVRITTEIKDKMVEMRKTGCTYSEICTSLGVTKERCIAYLKDIKLDRSVESALTNEWRRAELEAKDILLQMDFKNPHDLNLVCSFQPYWDYLVEKDGVWWLIDVTLNGQKTISSKTGVTVDGYEHAILLKTDSEWKLIKISTSVEKVIKF
jgi:hypothetical protein